MTTEKMLIIAVSALSGVIVFLFKQMLSSAKERRAETAEMVKERADWQAERAKMAADQALERQRLANEYEVKEAELVGVYEKRHREMIERYDDIARADSKRMLDHEDQVRREFSTLMERVEQEHVKSNDALVQMLNKFYDRFVGPRPHY